MLVRLVENGLSLGSFSRNDKLAAACTGPTFVAEDLTKVKLSYAKSVSRKGCLNNFTKMHLENTTMF